MTAPTAPPQAYPYDGAGRPAPQDHLAPAARARSAGVPLTLADGRTVRIRYGMAGLMALEQVFGSLGAARDVLGKLNDQTPVLTRLTDLLACGLVAELGGPELDYHVTRQALVRGDLLDPSDLQTYGQAAGQAFAQAFPASRPGGQEGQAETPAAPTAPAPGTTGTT